MVTGHKINCHEKNSVLMKIIKNILTLIQLSLKHNCNLYFSHRFGFKLIGVITQNSTTHLRGARIIYQDLGQNFKYITADKNCQLFNL